VETNAISHTVPTELIVICVYVNTSGGTPSDFIFVTYNVVDDSSVDITIDVIALDGFGNVVVILTIEQLSSCPSDIVNNIGPVTLYGMEMMYREVYGDINTIGIFFCS